MNRLAQMRSLGRAAHGEAWPLADKVRFPAERQWGSSTHLGHWGCL